MLSMAHSKGSTDCEDCGGEPAAPTLALPGSTFVPRHVEPREDRVLLYGNVGSGMQEFRYKIRAGNAGRFAVPPVVAEAMYERGVFAQGVDRPLSSMLPGRNDPPSSTGKADEAECRAALVPSVRVRHCACEGPT